MRARYSCSLFERDECRVKSEILFGAEHVDDAPCRYPAQRIEAVFGKAEAMTSAHFLPGP